MRIGILGTGRVAQTLAGGLPRPGTMGIRANSHLRVHLAGLRRKLEPDPAHPRYLITYPGLGLAFVPRTPVPSL
ncbi:hypothetical protein [Pseudonocardia acidicola]|uniref:hypothetical protein n=1 Tax=Pseudonocardia acidicola TaxID=2724939 RepID=UPI001B7CEC1C|nr:hypothetical protein [Pseudonocardia acidicola]